MVPLTHLHSEAATDDEAVAILIETLPQMPHTTRLLTRHLFCFLDRVRGCAADNKMHANNLAIVFAPTLLKPRDELDPK